MVSRSLVAAGSLAALLCLTAAAQSSQTTAPSTASQSPSGQNAPAQPAGGVEPGASPLHLGSLPPDPHTPTPEEVEQEHLQRLHEEALRLAATQARWGPAMSSPGISVAMVEAGRTKTPQGTQITWHLTGSGFALGEKLFLMRWPLDSRPENVLSGIVIDAKGNAVCGSPAPASATPAPATPGPGSSASAPAPGTPSSAADAAALGPACTATMKPDQPVTVNATAGTGEAIRIALVAEDRKQGAATSVVPFPISSTDKGCQLAILRGTKNDGLVLIEGSGFPANATLKLDTITLGETSTLNAHTNGEGRVVAAMFPGAAGHDAGETTVRFGGLLHAPSLKTPATPAPADPDCAPSVNFTWGKSSYVPQ